MAFLRFSRDKRGYEHFYLVEPTAGRGKSRNRILYWFRTPPGVKVGRVPFDDHIKRALEAQNPHVAFDWKKFLDTPIPPPAPDVEHWRERRKAEKAAKQAAALEAAADAAAEASEADAAAEASEDVQPAEPLDEPQRAQPEAAAAAQTAETPSGAPRRRRRRRGGRRGRPDPVPAPARAALEQAPPEAPTDREPDVD